MGMNTNTTPIQNISEIQTRIACLIFRQNVRNTLANKLSLHFETFWLSSVQNSDYFV